MRPDIVKMPAAETKVTGLKVPSTSGTSTIFLVSVPASTVFVGGGDVTVSVFIVDALAGLFSSLLDGSDFLCCVVVNLLALRSSRLTSGRSGTKISVITS